MKKKVIALLMAVTMAFGLAACGSSPDASDGGDKNSTDQGSEDKGSDDAGKDSSADSGEKILSVQIGPNPETIDPALNSTVDGGNMLLHAFECLLTIDQEGQVAEGQAEKWESSDDGLTWTFQLRDGLKWSDGSDLTANDFVYSWKRVCDPNVASPYVDTVLSMVEGFDEAVAGDLDALQVEATDDKTLVVKLSAPCTFFDKLAAFATLSPVQQATVEANGDKWATAPETYISNGPFYIAEWVPSSYLLMRKNENYWNKDAVKLDGIRFNLIEDANAAYSAYKTEEILMIKDVRTEEIPSLRDNDGCYVDRIIGSYYVRVN